MFVAFVRIEIGLSLLLFYVFPALVAAASVLWFDERLDALRWAALGVSMIGLVLTPGGSRRARRRWTRSASASRSWRPSRRRSTSSPRATASPRSRRSRPRPRRWAWPPSATSRSPRHRQVGALATPLESTRCAGRRRCWPGSSAPPSRPCASSPASASSARRAPRSSPTLEPVVGVALAAWLLERAAVAAPARRRCPDPGGRRPAPGRAGAAEHEAVAATPCPASRNVGRRRSPGACAASCSIRSAGCRWHASSAAWRRPGTGRVLGRAGDPRPAPIVAPGEVAARSRTAAWSGRGRCAARSISSRPRRGASCRWWPPVALGATKLATLLRHDAEADGAPARSRPRGDRRPAARPRRADRGRRPPARVQGRRRGPAVWGTLLKPIAWQGDLVFGPSPGTRVTFTTPEAASPRWAGLPNPTRRRIAIRAYLAIQSGDGRPMRMARRGWFDKARLRVVDRARRRARRGRGRRRAAWILPSDPTS